MNIDQRIWDLSKARFLQTEARLWLLGNKKIELLFLASLALWGYLEFSAAQPHSVARYVALLFTGFFFIVMRDRVVKYHGYFDGYEQGFYDGATNNLGYWSQPGDKSKANSALMTALTRVEENGSAMTVDDKEALAKEITTGMSKLVGYFLTWRPFKSADPPNLD